MNNRYLIPIHIPVTCALAVAVFCAMTTPVATAADAADAVAALANQVPDAGGDGKHTGPSNEDADKLCRAILEGGPSHVQALVGLLTEPDDTGDYKARYLLHALAIMTTNKGMEEQKRLLGDALIARLKGDGTYVRAFVLQELQFLKDEQAVNAIAALLTDELLCDYAVRALVDIRDGAGEKLATALGRVKGRSRLSIIQGLGRLGDDKAAAALIPILGDTAADQRAAAAVALSRIGAAAATDPMTGALAKAEGYDRVEITEACFDLAARLIGVGKKDDAFKVYRKMWTAMGDTPEPHVQHAIVAGLAEGLQGEKSTALAKMMSSGDAATRAAVLHVLGSRDDAAAFDVVSRAMSDKDPGVRMMAASVIGATGNAASVALLVKALPGDNIQAAQLLRSALLTVPGDQANKAMADALAAVPNGGNAPATRQILLGVLSQRNAREAGDVALKLVGDADDDVRVAALKALARTGEGQHVAGLITALGKMDRSEEFSAAEEALVETSRRISDRKQQVNTLTSGMGSVSEKAQCTLVRVIGRLGTDEAIAALTKTFTVTKGTVKDTAIRSLSEFANEKPRPQLLELARSAPEEKHQILALRGYVRMAERERDEKKRYALLADAMTAAKRPDEKKLVLGTMSKMRNLQVMQSVVGYLDDPELADEAGLAVTSIADRLRTKNPKEVREALVKVMTKAKGENVKKRARDLLSRVK